MDSLRQETVVIDGSLHLLSVSCYRVQVVTEEHTSNFFIDLAALVHTENCGFFVSACDLPELIFEPFSGEFVHIESLNPQLLEVVDGLTDFLTAELDCTVPGTNIRQYDLLCINIVICATCITQSDRMN